MIKLISATPSPYARKVRIALAEKGIPFELVTEVPWDRTTATPRYNPLEKLPILVLEDGSSVYESSFILQFLEWTYPDPPLLPAPIPERIAARRLEVLADGVCDAVVLTFFERRRTAESQSGEWLARQHRKIDGGIRAIAELVKGPGHAVGERLTLGDVAAGTVLAYLSVRLTDFEWRRLHPHLAAYSDWIEQRPSFASTRPVPQVISDKVV